MDLSEQVICAKNALLSALGANASLYLENMRLWFRYKWTKEEFDQESRKFLTPDKVYLHNQFMIAILNKIDAIKLPREQKILITPNSNYDTIDGMEINRISCGPADSERYKKSTKRKFRKVMDRLCHEPFDTLDYMMEDNLNIIQPAEGTEANIQIQPTQRYCAQELFIPDTAFILGRFLIGAWESGLTNVDDSVAEYAANAVQVLLKNLISAIIMKKQHYRMSGDYYYDVGVELRSPFIRNSVTRKKIDDAPIELDKDITAPNFLRRVNDDIIFTAGCEQL